MKQWSKFCQNEEFLEKTRMHMMNRDLLPMVISYLGLKPGMRVLDVACGTGEFSFYLSEGIENVSFTGLDLDADFITCAQGRQRQKEIRGNTFRFVTGDALQLPFESSGFDLVVSHTFFNSMPQYSPALREMKRVCKEDGLIASVTALNLDHVSSFGGVYPPETQSWKPRYDELHAKAYRMYETIAPMREYIQGIDTRFIPRLFAMSGLTEVSAYPLGQFFSLSNAATAAEDKKRYIQLDYLSEVKRLEYACKEPDAAQLLSPEEAEEFRSLLAIRRDYLLAGLGENLIWEWIGSANLLVTGRKHTTEAALTKALLSFIG